MNYQRARSWKGSLNAGKPELSRLVKSIRENEFVGEIFGARAFTLYRQETFEITKLQNNLPNRITRIYFVKSRKANNSKSIKVFLNRNGCLKWAFELVRLCSCWANGIMNWTLIDIDLRQSSVGNGKCCDKKTKFRIFECLKLKPTHQQRIYFEKYIKPHLQAEQQLKRKTEIKNVLFTTEILTNFCLYFSISPVYDHERMLRSTTPDEHMRTARLCSGLVRRGQWTSPAIDLLGGRLGTVWRAQMKGKMRKNRLLGKMLPNLVLVDDQPVCCLRSRVIRGLHSRVHPGLPKGLLNACWRPALSHACPEGSIFELADPFTRIKLAKHRSEKLLNRTYDKNEREGHRDKRKPLLSTHNSSVKRTFILFGGVEVSDDGG